MSSAATPIEAGLDRYQRLILSDETLRAEFESSLSTFFRGAIPAGEEALETMASARRHLEWFVFERHSPHLLNRPAEALLTAWQDSGDDTLAKTLLDSFCGLFEVLPTNDKGPVRAQDLSGLETYELVVDPNVILQGDLLVGRFYPVSEGVLIPSSACATYRNADLLQAVRRDIEGIREQRERKVFRIAQAELESMFFSGMRSGETLPEVPKEDAVQALRDWFGRGGLEAGMIEAVLADLREHAPAPDDLHPGSGDVVGHWLDQLAFSTELDLGESRSRLLAAWTALHRQDNAPEANVAKPASESPDVARAMAEFEQDCANGRGVTEALGDLERKLQLDDGSEESIGDAPDFPGVVAAMVEEFLWEEETEHGKDSVRGCETLRLFGEYGHAIGVFEEIRRSDLLDFLTRWIPENNERCPSERASDLVRAMARFCTWSVEAQGALGLDNSSELLESLADSLPRVLSANAQSEVGGELVRVDAIEGGRIEVTNVDANSEAESVQLASTTDLRVGDYLRLENASDPGTKLRVYPPELQQLLEELAKAERS